MKCGLLGRTLKHSYSPLIHGKLGDYSYELFEKEPEELENFLKNGGFHGLNVTIPYKKDVVPYCAELSPLAQELGSVNTLLRRPDGSLYGDNTDAWGFAQMAKALPVDYRGKKALVLGSGGASVTVQAVLKHLGCQVVVISRHGEDNYENIHRHTDAQVLVNATPVGTYPQVGVRPVDLDRLPNLEAVLDLVYNPAKTALILDAEARKIPFSNGLPMLVGQAARSSMIWTGENLSTSLVHHVYNFVKGSMENLILIGMPGCGKSTIGQKLAQRLNRSFVDTDVDIVDKVGNIPAYFVKFGESQFRLVETEVLARVCKESGRVIATGGGCVTREENYNLLHQNGTIIWIQRPLEELSSEGRPLSQRDGVESLYQQRKGLYERFADVIVENRGDVEDVVEGILHAVFSSPLSQGARG